MKAIEIITYVISLIFLVAFLITEDIVLAVGTLMYTVYSAEISIKNEIAKGRE